MPISVCIVCFNEADRFAPCLESVAWADEIIVLDLGSTDESRALAERHRARVISRPRVPIVEMVRNEVAAAARHDWILVLDPDERVTPGLAAELREVARRDDLDAVVIPRTNYDFGYPPSNPAERYEPQLRMYRRSRVRWPEVPNALPKVPPARTHYVAPEDRLVMIHDRSRNVREVLDRWIRYAPAQAQAMIDRGEVFTARGMGAALGRRLWRQLVQGRAWQDGVPGLLRVGILVGFHFCVWTAFWQLSGSKRTLEDDRDVRRLGHALAVLRRGEPMVSGAGRLLRWLRAAVKRGRR